ncbi:hypothetical protein Tco_1164040 [Tanacetum coccineum]
MDNPDITMEEYIQLEAEKERRRGQEFNWETATYGKVRYFEDIDYFKAFENEFPAIVYNDALTFEPKVSSEPTISARHAKKVDFDFVISFDESNDEDYTFTYDKNSFSYKLVYVNDLKSDPDNDNNKINIDISSKDVLIKSSDDLIDINVNTYSNAFDENIIWHNYLLEIRDTHDSYTRDRSTLTRSFMISRRGWVRYSPSRCTGGFASCAWRSFFDIRGPLVRELILEFFSTCRIAQGMLDLDTLDTLQF